MLTSKIPRSFYDINEQIFLIKLMGKQILLREIILAWDN